MYKGFTYYASSNRNHFQRLEDEGMTEQERRRCQWMIYVVGGLAGLQWQAFVPSLALVLTQGMGQPISSVGTVYAVFILSSIFGFVNLSSLVQREWILLPLMPQL